MLQLFRVLDSGHRERSGNVSGNALQFISPYIGRIDLVDTLTPEQRSERMSRVRGKNTKPEMRVRSLVHGLGYRYRLHKKDLLGKPDLVFPSRKKAIFVHGCFWHRHPDKSCKLARLPKSRLEFWLPKLEANRQRDLKHQSELEKLGWKSLVVWECQIGDIEELNKNICKFLEAD